MKKKRQTVSLSLMMKKTCKRKRFMEDRLKETRSFDPGLTLQRLARKVNSAGFPRTTDEYLEAQISFFSLVNKCILGQRTQQPGLGMHQGFGVSQRMEFNDDITFNDCAEHERALEWRRLPVGHQTFDCEPEDEMIDHGQSREASIDEAIKQKKAVAVERTQESVVIGQASALSKAVQTTTEMTFGKRNRISGRYGKGIMKLVYNHLRQGLRCKAYAKAFD